jgi:hypothetical protein
MHTTVKGKQVAVGETPRGPKHHSNPPDSKPLESPIVFLREAHSNRAVRRA